MLADDQHVTRHDHFDRPLLRQRERHYIDGREGADTLQEMVWMIAKRDRITLNSVPQPVAADFINCKTGVGQ